MCACTYNNKYTVVINDLMMKVVMVMMIVMLMTRLMLVYIWGDGGVGDEAGGVDCMVLMMVVW